MNTHDTNSASLPASDADTKVSHFIPSTEVSGTRAEKLQTLDTLIDHLMQLRRSLAGDVMLGRGGFEGPGSHVSSPAWPWFAGGVVLGIVFVLLLLTARACGQPMTSLRTLDPILTRPGHTLKLSENASAGGNLSRVTESVGIRRSYL